MNTARPRPFQNLSSETAGRIPPPHLAVCTGSRAAFYPPPAPPAFLSVSAASCWADPDVPVWVSLPQRAQAVIAPAMSDVVSQRCPPRATQASRRSNFMTRSCASADRKAMGGAAVTLLAVAAV